MVWTFQLFDREGVPETSTNTLPYVMPSSLQDSVSVASDLLCAVRTQYKARQNVENVDRILPFPQPSLGSQLPIPLRLH